MKCKKCKEEMELEEEGFEDGMVIRIWKCNDCLWSCKQWFDIDESMSSNDSWLDENNKEVW